jgi:4-hydroxybenzoate polyprenyltransferase
MGKLLYAIIKTARPRQWLKNVAIFSTILFTGKIFDPGFLAITIHAFIAFCFLSSSNYIFNDVLDAPKDRKHPFKKFRPVASGALPSSIAILTSLLFGLIGLVLSYSIGHSFFILASIFLVLSTATHYSSNS